MSESTPSATPDEQTLAQQDESLAQDELEVRDALLDHSDETYNAWIFAQLDAAEERARTDR